MIFALTAMPNTVLFHLTLKYLTQSHVYMKSQESWTTQRASECVTSTVSSSIQVVYKQVKFKKKHLFYVFITEAEL